MRLLKNNSKFFWEMFREDKSRRNPTHFIDTVDKTTLIENKAKIEKRLAKHFRDTGKDNLLSHRYQARVSKSYTSIVINIVHRSQLMDRYNNTLLPI
jgi:hypothetical protein